MEDHQGPGGSPSLPVPPEGPTAPAALEPGKSGSSAHRHVSRRTGLSKLCQSRMALSEERWSSYCLSSLAAQNICTSKLHCSATPGQADLTGSLGSTSCCSLLRALSSGWSTPLLPAPVCNPNKAVFTVDAKTTEVRASGCDPAAAWGLWPQLAASDGRPSVPVQLGERPGLPLQRRER